MGKEHVDHALTVLIELAHLLAGVALGHDGQVDAVGDVQRAVAARPDIVEGDAVGPDGADKDVLRVDGMRELAHHAVVEVGERHRHVHRPAGHGHVVAVLEGLLHTGGLLGGLPLLEERGKGVHEEELLRVMVAQADLPVATQGHFGQTCPPPGPLRGDVGLLQVDVLLSVAAREDIVEAQRATVEPLVELLGRGAGGHG